MMSESESTDSEVSLAEEACLWCQERTKQDLVRINLHCGYQYLHRECLELYLSQKKNCLICQQEFDAGQLYEQTQLHLEKRPLFLGLIWITWLILLILSSLEMHRLCHEPHFSSVTWMYVVSQIMLVLLFGCGCLFGPDPVTDEEASAENLQEGVYPSVSRFRPHPAQHPEAPYYLWGYLRVEHPRGLPLPYQLTRSVASSRELARGITFYWPMLWDLVSMMILIGVPGAEAKIYYYLRISWLFWLAPIGYLVLYPLFFGVVQMLAGVLCRTETHRRVREDLIEEYGTWSRLEDGELGEAEEA